jgi:broad specificity phosphatase PhoE
VRALPTPSRAFLCVRHGVTDWNREERFQGRTDVPLNEEGVAQAQAASLRLQSVAFDFIVSSPLIRAARTAKIIAAPSSRPITLDADLIECDFGSLEGRPVAEVMSESGITEMQALATILPADGEPWPEVSERSLRCVTRWLDHHPRADILFVGHDAVMQSMSEALGNGWFDNRHGVPFRFARTGDAWTVEEVG